MASRSLEDLRDLRSRIAEGLRVARVEGPAGDWVLRDGQLLNTRADYFRILRRRVGDGDALLIRQDEEALVGLVVTGPPGRRRILLNARAEPGLHGGCQFSTTVQSTPANYERRHGGAATPFLDTVLTSGADSRVIHDARQYDWGQYYDVKTKRFVIVEVPEETPVDEPLVWVDADDLRDLLADDLMATVDLRAAASALEAIDRGRRPASGPPDESPPDDPGVDLSGDPAAADDDGRSVVWVRTTTGSREVPDWIQPLVAVDRDLLAALAVRCGPGGLEVAVAFETRTGLRGRRLLFPAAPRGGRTVRRLHASAEGGRFLQHGIALAVVATEDVASGSWLPREEAEALALASVRTSVELRLLLGLLAADPEVVA